MLFENALRENLITGRALLNYVGKVLLNYVQGDSGPLHIVANIHHT